MLEINPDFLHNATALHLKQKDTPMTFCVVSPMPDDWHVHLSQALLLDLVVEFSGIQFFNNLVMPNTDPPITTAQCATTYYDQLIGHSRTLDKIHTRLALYLTRDTDALVIREARQRVLAAKFYPDGNTTRCGSGLSTLSDLQPGVLEAMEELDIVLCLHSEVQSDVQANEFKHERKFISHLHWLVDNYPDLRIVVECVSDRRILGFILELNRPANVGATITAHHPFLAASQVWHDSQSYRKPIAKTDEDRDYLAQIILKADRYPQIFFGSDSVPRLIGKEQGGSVSIWSSPVAIPVLWDHFDRYGGETRWGAWEAFMCRNGAQFYRVIPVASQRPTITLRRESWRVPDKYFGLKPWRAGEVLNWLVEGMEWFAELGEIAD